MNLCRQAAESFESVRDQKRTAGLQEHAIRSAQKAPQRAEALERHEGLAQAQKRQQGQSLERSNGLELGL